MLIWPIQGGKKIMIFLNHDFYNNHELKNTSGCFPFNFASLHPILECLKAFQYHLAVGRGNEKGFMQAFVRFLV